MIHFLVPAAGAFSIEEYLTKEGAVKERFRVIRYEDLASVPQFVRGTYVLAGLDQLSASAERSIANFYEQLSAAAGVRFLNNPTRTLRRVGLMNTLHRLHRSDFRIARAGDDLAELRYPVYLRQERFHGGNISPLLNSPAEVERALGHAVVAGYPWHDILVVEFCPTANPEGVYRKYAAFRVGPSIMARSCYVGRQWMLKFEGSEYTESTVLEEARYVRDNPHADQLAEIFDIAGVEYGQIDYSMKDGRVQTWEINLNPTIGRTPGSSGRAGPEELRPIRDATREHFFDRFRDAWAAVDLGGTDDSPVPAIAIRPIAVAPPHLSPGRVASAIRSALRPVKRVLVPLSGPFLRILAMAMRFRHRTAGPSARISRPPQ